MNIRKIILEEVDDFEWIRSVSGELPEINDQNKYLALVELLGVEEVFGDVTGFDDPDTEFEQNSWSHYGVDTFTLNNGEVWAVGTQEEFDEALVDYWTNFVDDVGLEGIHNLESYLTMSNYDREAFADDMADSYIEDLGDDDLLERSGLDDEFRDLENEIDEIDDEISDLGDERDGIDTSIDDKISELESKKEGLIEQQGRLIETAKQIVRDIEYDEWYDCLGDPYYCLVKTHGFYRDAKDLTENNLVMFDVEGFVEDQIRTGDIGDINHYDGTYEESSGYILMRID